MNIVRFSAVEQFGVPLYDVEILRRQTELMRLLGSYSIEPQEIPQIPVLDAIDITPFYFSEPPMHYFLARPDATGPVQIHLMPLQKGQMTKTESPRPGLEVTTHTDQRVITIPDDRPVAGILGGSPRFEQACIHELIIDLDHLR